MASRDSGCGRSGTVSMAEDENASKLIAVIDDLLYGRLTWEEFFHVYHASYGDARAFANEDRDDFFADVHERLFSSAQDVDEVDRRYGYVSAPEFIEWLSVKRSRYPSIDSSPPDGVLTQTDSESDLTREEFKAQLIRLIDAYLAGNDDWASFSEKFAWAWRRGFAATRAQLAKVAAPDWLERMWGMFDAVMSPGRRTVFGQVLELRKLAIPGDVDEKARRWGWMTVDEATKRLRELRSKYREEFGV